MDDHLAKPLDREELARYLELHLRAASFAGVGLQRAFEPAFSAISNARLRTPSFLNT
jgi:hypothetical protein